MCKSKCFILACANPYVFCKLQVLTMMYVNPYVQSVKFGNMISLIHHSLDQDGSDFYHFSWHHYIVYFGNSVSQAELSAWYDFFNTIISSEQFRVYSDTLKILQASKNTDCTYNPLLYWTCTCKLEDSFSFGEMRYSCLRKCFHGLFR